MRKIKATILSLLACSVFAFAEAAVGFARFSPTETPQAAVTAQAETVQTANATFSAELLSPSDYKQYLALDNPMAIAAYGDDLAVADGKTLYIYDSAKATYEAYSHECKLAELRYDEYGALYFSDENGKVYRMTNGTPQSLGITCSTFLVKNGCLYYAIAVKNQTSLQAYDLTKKTTVSLKSGILGTETPLAYGKDGLYYFAEGALHALQPQTKEERTISCNNFSIAAMAFIDDSLFCGTTDDGTTDDGTFFVYNYNELSTCGDFATATPVFMDKAEHSTLCASKGFAYVLQNAAVKRFSADAEDPAFDDFEICAASAANDRLRDATALCLNGDLLFIADEGNKRISVYDTATDDFCLIPVKHESPATYLASVGDTLLVASASEVVVYDLVYNLSKGGYSEKLRETVDTASYGNIIGAVGVYDRYYLLTDKNVCFELSAEQGAWKSERHDGKTSLARYPVAFTADAYGSLYVLYDNHAVYRFSESELCSAEAGVKIADDFPTTNRIATDYNSALYALADDGLHKFTADGNGTYAEAAQYDLCYGLVYDEAQKVVAFAFGSTKNEMFLLYDGDYLVKTDELELPVIQPVPVTDAVRDVFTKNTGTVTQVTVRAEALLIETDVNALSDVTEFPQLAFRHCPKERAALRLAEADGYLLLIFSDGTDDVAYLVAASDCETLAEADYRTPLSEADCFTGYLTNDVPLYKYPYMNGELSLAKLSRDKTVYVVAELRISERTYYEVRYETETGEQTGYIPSAYVTDFNPVPLQAETVTVGEPIAEQDSVWRFVYLLLGTGAICILVDFLLLRKDKNDEE